MASECLDSSSPYFARLFPLSTHLTHICHVAKRVNMKFDSPIANFFQLFLHLKISHKWAENEKMLATWEIAHAKWAYRREKARLPKLNQLQSVQYVGTGRSVVTSLLFFRAQMYSQVLASFTAIGWIVLLAVTPTLRAIRVFRFSISAFLRIWFFVFQMTIFNANFFR